MSNGNTQNLRRLLCLITAGIGLCVSAGTLRASPAVAGPISVNSQIVLASGAANGSIDILTVPTGFHLVVQTVSYFRSAAAAGSIGNLFVQTTHNNVLGYVAAPEAVADGSPYPSATLNATFYCAGGTHVIVNAYRSGSDDAQEVVTFLVTGNYVAN